MIIDPTLVPPLVRMELYEVPVRMMDAVIQGDAEQYVDCFVDDGVWDPQPLTHRAEGKDAIRRQFESATASLKWAFQGHFHTVLVSYSETSARLRTYLFEAGVFKQPISDTPGSPMGLGCYTDDLILVDGRWKVTLHDLSVIYFGSSDFANPMV